MNYSDFHFIKPTQRALSGRKLVCGVGVNDADYQTMPTINGKRFKCAIYSRWNNMIKRCYSEKYQKIKPTYIGCSISKEWLVFSNFRAWMIKQDWEGNHLDKDIVITGNKVYSKEKCIFVTQSINALLLDSGAIRGNCPQGVNFHIGDNKFIAHCNVYGIKKRLGCFDTAQAASNAYKTFKSNHIRDIALIQDEPLKGYLIRIASETAV